MKLIGITLSLLLLLAGIIWYLFFSNPPAPNSLAILPFKYTGGTESEFIADAFTDDIISSLSRLGKIKILSSGSTLPYKNTNLDDHQIAKELNVRYLVTGNIILTGDDITISYRLVDPANDKEYLNRTYEQKKDEIGLIRSAMIRQIATFLETN